MLDCSTVADGAAALLLAGEGLARELPGTLVRIAGSAVATDTLALHSRPDPLWLDAAARSSAAALRHAGLAPRDIHVLELTDPHGIAAALALEACGFAERGAGVQLAREGAITPGRRDAAGDRRRLQGARRHGGANGVYQVARVGAPAARRGRGAQVSGRAGGARPMPRRDRRDGGDSHFSSE